MGPIADFSCLGPKCRTDEGAPVYADLPIASTRCPVCGSKRIQRLYNKAPGMIRPGMRSIHHIGDMAVADAQAARAVGRDARLEGLKREAPAIAVPIREVAGYFGGRSAVGQPSSRPVGPTSAEAFSQIVGRQPIPGADSRRDVRSEKAIAGMRK